MIAEAFAAMFTPAALFFVFAGVFLGIVFGVVPGLSATMAVALCLPFTFGLPQVHAIALLIGLYIGGVNGGLITSILLNIPGTPSSIATTFDGYPMTKNGQGGRALGVGILYSFLGGLLSFFVLLTLAPAIARFALRFSPFEYFAVTVFSLTLISSLAGKSLIKGLLAGAFGISLAMVGMSPIDSYQRYTFGLFELIIGFNLLSVLIGFYAINEVIQAAGNKRHSIKIDGIDFKLKGFGITMKEFIQQLPNFIRSFLVGVGVGILPGIGGAVINIMAYGAAKTASKYPEKFGTGIIDGVIAPETSNSAAVGGALVPLLALGIPGDLVTAMILGGLLIHGLIPGPLMFVTNADVVWVVFISLMIANVMMILMNFYGIRLWLQLLRIPKNILLSVVVILCAVGTFGVNNRVFDIQAMFIFAAIGFGFSKLAIPLPPVIMGFILGPILETNLRRGLMMTGGDIMPVFTQPISAVLIYISIAVVIATIVSQVRKKKKSA